ncbi:MAG: cytochrome c, partial [Planctomycetaceae bacterium]|nr:cytochrome c [Planctomycetaceae bacterium]
MTSLRTVRIVGGLALSSLFILSGCQREKPLQFTPSEDTQKLSAELQQQVNGAVEEQCGTAMHPKMLGVETQDVQKLKLGQSVYMRRCVQCHGVSGDGNGPVAGTMYPRPRDYRRGVFKFTSTPYGAKPRREDLVRTVTVGVPGTSMPKFELLPPKEIDAVIEYVLMLTHRGELEYQLTAETAAAEEFDSE